jgi:hypothetical protein
VLCTNNPLFTGGEHFHVPRYFPISFERLWH